MATHTPPTTFSHTITAGSLLPLNLPRATCCSPLFCCSWWVLDLGAEHHLICNFYSLRHDGSTDFLRNWVLQVGQLRSATRGGAAGEGLQGQQPLNKLVLHRCAAALCR